MSLDEIAVALHDLVNAYQVALSSVEIMEDDPMPPELRKKVKLAKRSLVHGIDTVRRMQAMVRAMCEEERESIQ